MISEEDRASIDKNQVFGAHPKNCKLIFVENKPHERTENLRICFSL